MSEHVLSPAEQREEGTQRPENATGGSLQNLEGDVKPRLKVSRLWLACGPRMTKTGAASRSHAGAGLLYSHLIRFCAQRDA